MTITHLTDLEGKTVAFIEHNAAVKWIQKYPQIQHRIYKYAEQGLLALMSGDVDGFVYPIPIVEKLVERIGVDDRIRQLGVPLLGISRAVAVHESRKELLEHVNKAVTTIVGSPEYHEIEKRWHDNDEPVTATPDGHFGLHISEALIIALLLLVAVIILWQLSRPGSRRGKLVQGIMLVMTGIIIVVLVTRDGAEQGGAEKHAARIAVVQLSKVDSSTYAGFLVKMKELGYKHGSDIEMIYKGPAGSIDRLDGLVREKLALKPDLVLVSSTPGTLAVKRLTEGTDIPVVFAPVNDPVDAGIVPSMQHPQGHITGVRLPPGDDLRLQWLTRFSPQIHRVYVPYTEGDKSAAATIRQISAVAPQLGVELITDALDSNDMVAGKNSVVPDNIDAIYLPRDSTVEARIAEFSELANVRKLPLCAPSAKQVQAGALFSYGFVHYEIGRQAGQLVDQILRGARPADLPVLTAENYLLLNMKVAQQIGIEVPEMVLHQANRLIY